MKRPALLLLISMLAAPFFATAQIVDINKYLTMIYRQKQEGILTFLADDKNQGRAMGTQGGRDAGIFIKGQFEKYGLQPFYGQTFIKSFKSDSLVGRNIIGVVPSKYYSDEYIVISAHYDHLGVLDKRIFNGADDNASGVTALLNLAEMVSSMRKAKEGPTRNIIFAAFDGKESNMAGSEFFVKNLPIPNEKILFNINIDMIGSIFAPPYKDTNYVLVLGAEKNGGFAKEILDFSNKYYKLGLEIDYSFYGSRAFADIFYKTSDQNNFVSNKIPAVMFTSGIHAHTYKPTDDADYISYPVMAKRTRLIFCLLYHFMISE